jgi:hypothetical protein
MAKSYAELEAAIQATAEQLSTLSPERKAIIDKIVALSKEDPCVEGFAAKLDEVDAAAEKVNAQSAALIAAINKNIDDVDEAESGFFGISVAQFNTLIRQQNVTSAGSRALNEMSTKADAKTKRTAMRTALNACSTTKPAEEEPETNDDPGANEDPDAEDDVGSNQDQDDKGDSSSGTGTTDNTVEDQSSVTPAGTTTAGKAGTASSKKNTKPNKRQQNPLGNLSSYTYNITLYMITPDAYNAFIASNRKDIDALKNSALATGAAAGAAAQVKSSGAGAYVLAQSGGVNNNSSSRAPGFDLDYYIDNLKLITNTSGKKTTTASNTIEISFDIIEPYGFSFISNLKRARDAIMQNSKLPNAKEQKNSLKQFFVLGLRFYGYDKDGNVANGTEHFSADTSNPVGNSNGLFERFYDINITEMKFKIDGRSTVYNVTAKGKPESDSMNTKNGRMNKDIQVQANNVYNALMGDGVNTIGLLSSLNDQQQKMVEDGTQKIANIYNVEFIGPSEDLKNASLIIPSNDEKSTSGMIAAKINQSNDSIAVDVYPNLQVKQIRFKNDTSILQAISLIISQSDYLFNAMKTVYTSKLEPDENGNDSDDPGSKKRIRWYNLGSRLECLGYDTQRNEWAYKITYVIQPYETPYLLSPCANASKPYYGPHKRYEYWYTGKNSEILRYEQQINNAFFTVGLGKSGSEEGANDTSGSVQLGVQPQMRTSEARVGSTGKAAEAQNTYLTSLYDPHSWATAKVQILGDPDYLCATSPAAAAADIAQVYDPYYQTDSFTINPNGGQVFVEINFNEPEDYHNKDGLLSINESMQFVEVPKEVRDQVKGVSYMLLKVTSTFRSGAFQQELDLNITTWSDIIKKQSDQERAESSGFVQAPGERGRGTNAPASTPSGSNASGTGLAPYETYSDAMGSDDGAAIMAAAADSTTTGSADDDR